MMMHGTMNVKLAGVRVKARILVGVNQKWKAPTNYERNLRYTEYSMKISSVILNFPWMRINGRAHVAKLTRA
jgi:hypothetical protein